MSDLREALDKYEELTGPWYIPPWVRTLADAARRVETADDIWWCETHGSSGDEAQQTWCDLAMRKNYQGCRMVRRPLLRPGNEQ